MGTNTTKLGLRKPGENDFYNQQTEQADNWDKVDKFADDIQNLVDNNSGKKISGYIQDEGEKVAGSLYLDKITDGIYYCHNTNSSTVNSSTFFTDYSNLNSGKRIDNIPKNFFSRQELSNLTPGATASFPGVLNIITNNSTGFLTIFDHGNGSVKAIYVITKSRDTSKFTTCAIISAPGFGVNDLGTVQITVPDSTAFLTCVVSTNCITI